jgi:pyruvate/2-oxoglutarate dehydrogenase complex dihydrolipoamide dehydrogenase (E3) component
LVVIGYGTVGPVSAAGAALVERQKLGGDCPYRGCVPTKALAMSARIASLIGHSEGFGIKTAVHEVDFPTVTYRM